MPYLLARDAKVRVLLRKIYFHVFFGFSFFFFFKTSLFFVELMTVSLSTPSLLKKAQYNFNIFLVLLSYDFVLSTLQTTILTLYLLIDNTHELMAVMIILPILFGKFITKTQITQKQLPLFLLYYYYYHHYSIMH